MSDQVLSLKWNNHQMSFNSKIAYLYNKDKFTDVTIACDEKLYPAHKLILSTCSEYFDRMFSHIEDKHPIIVLKDITQKTIEMLLNYMYLGEVNVDQAELPSLMKAAECLRIKGLAVSDNEEEKPKKRKLPSDNSSMKRKFIESSQNNRTQLSSSNSGNVSNPSASDSSKRIRTKSVSPPLLQTKKFEEIMIDPIKQEKIEPSEDTFYEDNLNLGSSNVSNYDEESFLTENLPPDEDYQDYPSGTFEPGPSEPTEGYSPSQQAYATESREMKYCDHCNYNTFDKSNMNRHKLVHTGELPYHCKFCPFKTRQGHSLKRHIKIKHPSNIKLRINE